MTVRYKADYAGTRELMNGQEMQQVMRQAGEELMARAAELAPVRTGEYKSRFRLEVRANGGVHHDRAEALVINDSGHSVLVELYDEFHTLRDAAAELGAL